jgi:hypothetical protein
MAVYGRNMSRIKTKVIVRILYCIVTEIYIQEIINIIIQFVPHRRYISYHYNAQPVTAVRTLRNTQIHFVGRMQSYSTLKRVVHVLTAVL